MSLDAFNNRQRQDTKAMLETLVVQGVTTIADALEKLSSFRQTQAQAQKHENICPECQVGHMVTTPVNRCRASQVGGGYKAVKACKRCNHEEWVK